MTLILIYIVKVMIWSNVQIQKISAVVTRCLLKSY